MVKSKAWDHFTVKSSELAQCKICPTVIKTKGSRNDADLITADAAITFLIDTLTKESNKNNTHAQVMRDFVVKRINQRRNHVLVLLMKYLVKGDLLHTDLITGTKVNKSNLHAKANAMFATLFGNASVVGCEDNDVVLEEEEEQLSMSEQLDRVVAESTQQKDNQTTQRVPLTQDFKLFEATKKRSDRLEKLFQALLTTKPTSVDSERSFSVGGSFCTKIRSRMNDNTLSALVSLKQYFKNREQK